MSAIDLSPGNPVRVDLFEVFPQAAMKVAPLTRERLAMPEFTRSGHYFRRLSVGSGAAWVNSPKANTRAGSIWKAIEQYPGLLRKSYDRQRRIERQDKRIRELEDALLDLAEALAGRERADRTVAEAVAASAKVLGPAAPEGVAWQHETH